MTELRALVTGRVHGVAYRAYVQDAATALNLTGYVKNLPNGSVEVVAHGAPDVLKELVEYLHEGSLASRVDSVSAEWGTAKRSYDDFSIKH